MTERTIVPLLLASLALFGFMCLAGVVVTTNGGL